MKRAMVCALALGAAACTSDLSSPFSAVTISYDTQKQSFHLAQVRVATMVSLRHLSGGAGQVRAGGSVAVRAASVLDPAATVQSLRAKFILASPSDVDLSWSVINDIVYPENYTSLELLTAYYNLERARGTFTGDWALDAASLPALPIVAHASVTLDDGKTSALGDGELYYPPLATFYLPASATGLPLVFNLGAVAHALGHEAVAQIVWGESPVPAPELGPQHDPAWNSARHLSRSLAEGLGDFLGVALTDDPRWFDHSVAQSAATRALDTLRCGSSDMLLALAANDDTAPYDPFPLGSVLAGALWETSQAQASPQAGVQLTARGALASLKDLGLKQQASNGQLQLAVVLDTLVADSDVTLQPALCGLFLDRFAKLSVSGLPSCMGGKVVAPAVACQ